MARIRVISGQAKGQQLSMVPGDTTRPITDRVKENLFNILGDSVIGTYWLDLFAGTGQVGIEALSRGADGAIFIDNASAAVRTIKANLQKTRLDSKGIVLKRDAFDFLTRDNLRRFDVIYIAPPQYRKLWIKALNLIDQMTTQLLAETGQVIVQIDPSEFVEPKWDTLLLSDMRIYGRTMLCFFTNLG